MRILHTVQGISMEAGGVSRCIYDLSNAIRAQGITCDILTFASHLNHDKIQSSNIYYLTNNTLTRFAFSAFMRTTLKHLESYDLWHTDGMWLDINYSTLKIGKKRNITTVFSPHGMLYPQAFANHKWLKSLFLAGGFRSAIESASCLHATCEEEAWHLRNLGICLPIAIIPNPVPLPEFSCTFQTERKKIGYLGRLHPRKHVERLIDIWNTRDIKVELLIMGDGEASYVNFLKKRANGNKKICFLGFIDGLKKFQHLSTLRALVVPSDFENFGMIVPEAWAVRTPVIASRGTPWRELETHHCGWWVDNTPEALAAAVHEALTLPESELTLMGENGYRLLHAKYSAEKVAAQMIRLYRWLLGEAERPEFVQIQ